MSLTVAPVFVGRYAKRERAAWDAEHGPATGFHCTSCDTDRPLDQFWLNKGKPCNPCIECKQRYEAVPENAAARIARAAKPEARAKKNAQAAAKRAEDPEAYRQQGRKYYRKDIERSRARSRKHAAKPEQKARKAKYDKARNASRTPEQRRARALRYNHGLSVPEWNALFDMQGRCCAICKRTDPNSVHGWATDHDHAMPRETLEQRKASVRSILCYPCNTVLGAIREDTEWLNNIMEYADEHNRAAFNKTTDVVAED